MDSHKTGFCQLRTSPSASMSSRTFTPLISTSRDHVLGRRIMRKSLPANAKIAKDAKETVQECVSEFISFITSEASDKCRREERATINGEDLLWAIHTLGFEDYVEPLGAFLQRYREVRSFAVQMFHPRGGG